MKKLLNLQNGKKYTLVFLGDLGFPISLQISPIETKIAPYAQYEETLVLTFKQKGKRLLRQMRIYGYTEYLVYEGWITVDTEMYVEELPEDSSGLVVKRSLRSFDPEYLQRAKRSVAESPIIEELKSK